MVYHPEGRITQYLRTLAPRSIPSMAFGTRVLKNWGYLDLWVRGPSKGESGISPGSGMPSAKLPGLAVGSWSSECRENGSCKGAA